MKNTHPTRHFVLRFPVLLVLCVFPTAPWAEATARFCVSEARKSDHSFPEAHRDALIYSAPIVYTGKGDWIYEQVYVFCPTDQVDYHPSEVTQ